MALAAGDRLGVYEIVALLGSGGMGDVYRARDLRLGRDVAIKVLRGPAAADADRRRRFEREARLLAALSHPHIGAIHGLEDSAGELALVLELVEGPTLAGQLASGPLPLEEALNVARQIAEALEAAHEKGIIHRDLKPSNIKVMANGNVKVLDFGLAKAFLGDDLAHLPTVTIDGTAEGRITGTPAYMSPEQATGEPIDKRTDIWSFGVVLYETLTGRRLIIGASRSDVLAGVLKTEPDWNALPAATPPAIRILLRRCLTRDVKRRLQAIGEARIALEDSSTHRGGTADANLVGRSQRVAWTVAAAALVLTSAVMLTALYVRQGLPTTAAPSLHVEITTPQTVDPFSMAISPDGRRLAFVGRSGDVERLLWIRSLDAPGQAQPLPGTDGAYHPFWSPNGRSIGFFSPGYPPLLKAIDLGGAAPRVLCSFPGGGLGGTWSADDVIVFGSLTGPLYQVSASGGEAVAITTLEGPQDSHRWPFFLPDGRHLLFMSGFLGRTADVRLLTLGTPGSRHLLQADSATAYGFGHLFYLREGTLVAQRFDAASQQLSGAPIQVAERVAFQQNRSEAAYSVSATGAIAYRATLPARRQLMRVDRSGKELGTLGEYEGSAMGTLELDPHGKRVAFAWTWTEGNADVYVMETDQGTAQRFTLGPKADFNPIWSPDGSRIVFSTERNGTYDLYEKLSTGAGSEKAVLESPLAKVPSDWSRDGRFLLYWQFNHKTQEDLWVLPMVGEDRKPFAFAEAESSQLRGRFSPNGKWVAYQSNELGRSEIYVQAFPGPGGTRLVSTNGGGHSPRWARNGSELYYIAADGTLMAAPVRATADVFTNGPPTALFQTRLEGRRGESCGLCIPNYDVDADGRFLMPVVVEEPSAPISLILNWPTSLKK